MSMVGERSSSDHRSAYALLLFSLASALSVLLIRSYGGFLYPFYIILYSWIVLYVLLLSAVIRWQRNTAKPLLNSFQSILVLIACSVIVRLLFLGTGQIISLDSLWYVDYGKFMAMGNLPYFDFYFPYPPVFAYLIYPITLVFPSPDAFRILASLLDGLIVIVLFKIVSHFTDERWASITAFAYAFLPLSIIESGWNGHFDPLANFLMLAAIWLMLEKHYRLASISAAIGAAVKIYPIFVLPVIILQASNVREKAISAVLAISTGVLSFAPVLMLDALKTTTSSSMMSPQAAPFSGIISSLLGPLLNTGSVYSYTGIFVVILVCIGILLIIYSANSERKVAYTGRFQWGGFALGLTLIVAGMIAGIFPFTFMANQFNWQFPWDIALVRGVTTCSWGAFIIVMVHKIKANGVMWHGRGPVLTLFAVALVVLLSAFMRVVFFGWYLLWSLPLFLLVPRKHLAVMALVALVLLYPNYTDEYSMGLGFSETKSWEQPFNSLDAWQALIHPTSSTEELNITYGVTSMNGFARFWANLSSLPNQNNFENLTIIFRTQVHFEYDLQTKFRTQIRASWDPTFGQMSEVSISYGGLDSSSHLTNGTIIPRSGLFTNLTKTSWTYSFSSDMSSYTRGIVENITLTLYPIAGGYYFYDVDAFYAIEGDISYPLDFLMIPLLVAMPLLSCMVLFREVKDYSEETYKNE